ncbi:MAG: PE family protein [Proteobacteria bacterium]|nr:PE family protein [Pseudomonadota bacterium]
MTSSHKPLTPQQLKSVVGGSFVMVKPEVLSAAAGNLSEVAAALSAANVDAVKGQGMPTTSLAPAASDEVSAATAAQFASHSALYQQVSAQAAAIHEQFANTLSTGGGSYQATDPQQAAKTDK